MDDSEVAGLYALTPERFVAARDALAKRLRTEGQRQEAAQVRALARPTVPAWALNQVTRSYPAEIEALIAIGAELRSAQGRALSGQGGARLREAGERRREAVKALSERAAAVLSDSGRDPSPHLAVIASALEAASVDEQAAAALRAGRLSKPPEPESGFPDSGIIDWTGLDALPAAPPLPPKAPAAEDRQRGTAERTDDQAREQARKAQDEADAAAAAARQARRAAERAYEEARERAREAQQEADAAAAHAGEAHQQAQAAAAEVARLEDLLEQARTAARRATDEAAAAEQSASTASERAARLADLLAKARADLPHAGGSPIP